MRLYKTAYTLAVTAYENYSGGPGGTSDAELQIHKMGAYGTGDFPPVFAKREDAANFALSRPFPGSLTVVEVEYRD